MMINLNEQEMSPKVLYKCTKCDKEFILERNLKSHELSHSTEEENIDKNGKKNASDSKAVKAQSSSNGWYSSPAAAWERFVDELSQRFHSSVRLTPPTSPE